MKYVIEKIKNAAIHIPELLLVFFAPAVAQIGLVVLAILADTATGIWAAKKSGEILTTKKASPIVPKACVYIMLILLAHGIEVVFEVSHARTLAALALVTLELVSIDENFKKATGKGIFKPIIGMLKRK